MRDLHLLRESFSERHIGPSTEEQKSMVKELGYASFDQFLDAVVPKDVRRKKPLILGNSDGWSEAEVVTKLKEIGELNRYKMRSFIGLGYAGTITPSVISRNILESPGWYTSYTPYQAEISQGLF